jgi:hypothetical protein
LLARVFVGSLAVALAVACAPSRIWHGHSPDRRHRVELLERRGEQYVVLDDVEGRRWDGVAPETVVFSPDSQRLAYAAQQGEQWLVVVDGEPGQLFDGIGGVIFSPNGRRVAYSAQQQGQWLVVLDNQQGPVFDELKAGSLRFGPNSQRLAYIGQRRPSVHAVIDGQVGPAYEAIAALILSDDGERVGYIGRGEEGQHLVMNGEPGEPFLEVAEFAFGGGDHLAAVVRDESGWRVVIDGEEGSAFESVFGLRYGPDGTTIAYVVRDHGRERVVVGSREEPAFDLILPESVTFAPVGDRIAYVAVSDEDMFVVVDGEPGPQLDRVGRPVFSSSGERLAYSGERGGQGVVVIDGRVIDDFPWAGNPVFSPDGTRLAFLARQSDRMLVLDHSGLYAFDVIVDGSLVFADDSQHFACLAGSFEERELRLVVNGEATERIFDWDELIAGVSRDPFAYTADEKAAALFRDWVAAELVLELERRKP